jgi:hypothetical protein
MLHDCREDAGQFHTGRTRADDDDGEERALQLHVIRLLRLLQRQQKPVPQ